MGRIIEHPGATTLIFFATEVLAATLRMDRGMSSGRESIERVLCIRRQRAAAVPRSTTNAGADHFGDILADATTNLDDPLRVRCRRRPQRRRCAGFVMSYPTLESGEPIYWHCPLCRDEGWIHGWQNTFWDGLTPEQNEQTPHCRRFAISGA